MAKKNQSKIKSAAPNYPIPHSRDEADEFIREIGNLMRDRDLIQTALNGNLAALKAEYEDKAKPINDQLAYRHAGLQDWCEVNRAELLHDGGKTVKFGNGEVAWRNRPASVTLRGVDAIIAYCKEKLDWLFLRINVEVSKEIMLMNPDLARTIPGVSIASAGEDFIVTPLSAELEKVAS